MYTLTRKTSVTAIILAICLLFSACAGKKVQMVKTPTTPAPKTLTINRGRLDLGKLFNALRPMGPEVEEFYKEGNGWSILGDETDKRSAALKNLDLSKIQLATILKDNETRIRGDEKLQRLKKSDYVRLDADIFFTLWENQHLIPESWKQKVNGIPYAVSFDGTTFRAPNGQQYVLSLYWPISGGHWCWNMLEMNGYWDGSDRSAVVLVN